MYPPGAGHETAMKWNRYRLKIAAEAEDIVISALADAGVQGVEIEDSVALTAEELGQMFVDIPPSPANDDGVAYLQFYLDPAAEDTPEILSRVREELEGLRAFCEIGEASIEVSGTENADWENEWKKYFQPFRIDDIYIVPSWVDLEDDPNAPALTLRIDPGTAFGTGMHETTQLCIRQMRKHLRPGANVLDIGTGSGILGILALKFGANAVMGTDLDPHAEPAVEENCRNNGIVYRGRLDGDLASEGGEDGFSLVLGNLIDDPAVQRIVGEEKYDIVFSNILADVLVPLAPAAARALRPGGFWITSGILEGKENLVAEAAEAAGLRVKEVSRQGEWMSVTAWRAET